MKKAIIVGATSGIGRELASILIKNNFKVGITGRRLKLLEQLKSTSPDKYIVKSFDCTMSNNLNSTSQRLSG